jgi:hypothetical protein
LAATRRIRAVPGVAKLTPIISVSPDAGPADVSECVFVAHLRNIG